MLVSSFGSRMKLSVAQRGDDMQVVDNLAAGLREIGVEVKMEQYPFRVTKYNGLECGQM